MSVLRVLSQTLAAWQIGLFGQAMTRSKIHGYYAILDVAAGEAGDREGLCVRARELLAAGPCCLQLRAKHASARELFTLGEALLPMARAAGVPFCVNDRLDVALVLGAEVVHLGQEDIPLAEARRIASGRIAVGVSTHSLAQAEAAIAGGADHIGFGPVFATRTKDRPDPVVGLEGLRAVCARAGVPVVAIGGITLKNVGAVAQAGASAAAVVAAVAGAASPVEAGRAVGAAFT